MNLRKYFARVNPWYTLFGKIFLWFWLTSILIIAMTSIVVKTISRPYQIETAPPEYLHILASQGQRLLLLYNRFGSESLRQLNRINELERVRLYLVDDEFRVIGLPRPPRNVFPMLTAMLEEPTPVMGYWRGETWLGPATLELGDQTFLLLLRGVQPPEQVGLYRQLHNETMVFSLALLMSGLLSAFLAWSFSRPLRRFRRASQELASGHLDTRVGPVLTNRLDEFGELGRDFDEMAIRLQNLVNAQQRLLSNVSHELRSPITRIQVALGIASQKASDGMTPTLERIERETQKLEEMIAQVLHLSRLENQMQSIQLGPVNLDSLLKQLTDDAHFEAQASERSVTYQCGHTCWVNGEASLLHSALENVVRNAIRYTAEDTAVEIETRDLEFEHRKKIEILVRDHGPGVTEEVLEHLFEPFYRAVENTADGGAGLGLSIAEQIISRHQGTISARNRVEGGLEVVIQMPALPAPKGS